MAPPSPTEFREVGRISHSSLLRELRVWVKCLFLQLHRFLGEGITHKVNFLRGWSQVLSKKTKQNKLLMDLERGALGNRQACLKRISDY